MTSSAPHDSAPAAKEELRREMRRRLAAMGEDRRAEASLFICGAAAQLPAFRAGQCVALFAPLATEPDIRPLIEEAWAQGKRVILPRMPAGGEAPRLEWRAVTAWDELIERGPFGLREPDHAGCPEVAPGEIDCVFVPGLAFDGTGLRLGRGGGHYDRFLAQAAASLPRVGLMFACQRAERLPREPHDQALPAVMTEEGLLTFSAVAPNTVRSIQPPPITRSPT